MPLTCLPPRTTGPASTPGEKDDFEPVASPCKFCPQPTTEPSLVSARLWDIPIEMETALLKNPNAVFTTPVESPDTAGQFPVATPVTDPAPLFPQATTQPPSLPEHVERSANRVK